MPCSPPCTLSLTYPVHSLPIIMIISPLLSQFDSPISLLFLQMHSAILQHAQVTPAQFIAHNHKYFRASVCNLPRSAILLSLGRGLVRLEQSSGGWSGQPCRVARKDFRHFGCGVVVTGAWRSRLRECRVRRGGFVVVCRLRNVSRCCA